MGISWFDFYSIGHITFGVGVFLFFSLLYTIPKLHDKKPVPWWLVMVMTIIILIGWEFLENMVMYQMGVKFEGRLDSPQNIFTDITLGITGACVACLFAYEIIEKDKNIWGYYIFGLISFAIWLICFFILRFFTYWATTIY